MAKGEQRGNREAKKPKQEKPKAAPAAPVLILGFWDAAVWVGSGGGD